MEASACSKLQRKLLTQMKNIAIFLAREVTYFEGDLVPDFCAEIFKEYTQFLNDQNVQVIFQGLLLIKLIILYASIV